jgi:hypothetical protein
MTTNPQPPKHQPYIFRLVGHARRHDPRPLLLRDGSEFKWSSVTRVHTADSGWVMRYTLEAIEKRHEGIHLAMGGFILDIDVGARLIVDERESDGRLTDCIDYTPLLPIDLRSRAS